MQLHEALTVLKQLGTIRDTEIQPAYKPGHGSCCTCQACGRCYNDCVCDDNAIINALTELETKGTEQVCCHVGDNCTVFHSSPQCPLCEAQYLLGEGAEIIQRNNTILKDNCDRLENELRAIYNDKRNL